MPETRPFEPFRNEALSSISNGRGFACALREDGTAACWGDNYAGKATPPPEEFAAISSGTDHACGLRKADGRAICWGSDRQPDYVYKKHMGMATPPYDRRFTRINSGHTRTCGLEVGGTILCWGDGRGLHEPEPGGDPLVERPTGAPVELEIEKVE
jgi:alpha-tubulin suppressor-like RCC1 family protein